MKKIIIQIDTVMKGKNWKHTLKSDFTRDETINVLKNMLQWVEDDNPIIHERIKLSLKKVKVKNR